MGEWICASCGAEHEHNDPPCRECGSERFAKLEPEPRTQIDSMADVEWACKQCGRIHQRNNPPCNECGGFQFERVDDGDDDENDDEDESDRPFTTPSERSASSTSNTTTTTPSENETDQTAYYIGLLSGFGGVLFLPFIFGLVAIVESPLQLSGRSIGNVLSSEANDGVRGAFQAFAWSGHFFWALMVLAFVGGFFIGLL